MENFWNSVKETSSSIEWIKPGINNVVFGGFSVKLDKNGKPMLVRTFWPIGGSESLGNRSQYESFLPGVNKRTVKNQEIEESNYYKFAVSLIHFLTAMIKQSQVTEIMYRTLPVINATNEDVQPTEAQLQAFVDAINPLVVGKTVRYKFVGQQVLSQKEAGKVIEVPSLKVAYVPYAEALEAGAEKPVLEETKLRFDASKNSDMKVLAPVAPDAENNAGGDFFNNSASSVEGF
jgi:hypothetical protein